MPIVGKFVLAGGDAGGKTNAQGFLRRELEKDGYAVVFVPEAATKIITEYGIKPAELSPEKYMDFQRLVLLTQVQDEDTAIEYADKLRSSDKIVLFFDRGCMDGKAFFPNPSTFDAMIKEFNLYPMQLREARYDAIFHLVTSADGAEEVYNRVLKDNPARHGRPADNARELDKRIQNVWLGHPHLRIIDNSTDFDGKLERLLLKVKSALGSPHKVERERKFLVNPDFGLLDIPVPNEIINITQYYLLEKGARIRQWSQVYGEDCVAIFSHTRKTPTDEPDANFETENAINAYAYVELRKLYADPSFDPIIKNRSYFLHKGQYFSLDKLVRPKRHKGLGILEIELDDKNGKVELPPWLGEVEEVTGDKRGSNRHLAKRP